VRTSAADGRSEPDAREVYGVIIGRRFVARRAVEGAEWVLSARGSATALGAIQAFGALALALGERVLERSYAMSVERHTQLGEVPDQRGAMMQVMSEAMVRDVVAAVTRWLIHIAQGEAGRCALHRTH